MTATHMRDLVRRERLRRKDMFYLRSTDAVDDCHDIWRNAMKTDPERGRQYITTIERQMNKKEEAKREAKRARLEEKVERFAYLFNLYEEMTKYKSTVVDSIMISFFLTLVEYRFLIASLTQI